ncbi:winged helix-turn-helix transcriptional regulator [Rhodococcus spelaei]|uniref:Winged helix-turn-helix transcriptional regulator n=1 Tax=Rhodococcus spelaei TaxID=2546320 RepID=A0A541BRU5_9NOCA|nr:winged helix-turn-helix domain-containing protein [Rhodococcus spelaei]TQF75018.1 winged helix-turn-helix transcriptional regulator [Rhodococcus spelaei]
MPISPTGQQNSTNELVLTLQFSHPGSADRQQLIALANALRTAAQEIVPGVSTRARVDTTPATTDRRHSSDAPLLIDLPARQVLLHGTPVSLSHTEFEILSHLARRPRVVVSRRRLLELSGTLGERERTGRSVDVHVSRVRTKLDRFGWLVTTVRGTGYRFDPDPRVRIVAELAA